jgi:hypothetical protein
MRALLLIHRYLGIAVGVVMAMWCASGFVMMYVSYPTLHAGERLQALEAISWQACCDVGRLRTQLSVDALDSFEIEMLAGRPVLRASMTQGRRHVFDLITGERLEAVDRAQALAVAKRYAIATRSPETPRYLAAVDIDQWTVSGQFGRDRPLHKIWLGDPSGTHIYVSGTTGQVVQRTDARQRFWNWVGAIPHWLYPTALRKNGALWNQIVVGLSLAGVFLTAIGLYVGLKQWLAAGRSPYRRVHLWHHISGLIFGVLTLTWVGSGLLSMNPWGFLESSGPSEERERVRDMWIDHQDVVEVVTGLATRGESTVARIVSAPVLGRLYLVVHEGATVERLNAATLERAPLDRNQVDVIARRIAPNKAFVVDFLPDGDEYYYSGHEAVTLPVYRVVVDNADRTRYYLDPFAGDIVGKADAARRGYRWLFEGLHRFDFTAGLRKRPWWDLLVLPLLAGVTVVCFTGVYLAYKRVVPKTRPATSGRNDVKT